MVFPQISHVITHFPISQGVRLGGDDDACVMCTVHAIAFYQSTEPRSFIVIINNHYCTGIHCEMQMLGKHTDDAHRAERPTICRAVRGQRKMSLNRRHWGRVAEMGGRLWSANIYTRANTILIRARQAVCLLAGTYYERKYEYI